MGSRDVIKYGPATLAALERELAEPITSAIANPAPIEHGLVMVRSSRGLHAGDYTVGDALGLRRDDATTRCEACQFERGERTECLCDRRARRLAASLRTLARNLRDAGSLWLAHTGIDDTDGGKWWPGCGRAAPGWER